MNRTGEVNITDTFPYFDLLDQVLADNSSVEPHHVIESHSVDEVSVVSSRSESPYSNLCQMQDLSDTDIQTEEMSSGSSRKSTKTKRKRQSKSQKLTKTLLLALFLT